MSVSLVVKILADGQFHSGESLGAALGVTRAAVWKRLQGLAALGLPVESVKGRGYRIAGGLCLLDGPAISAKLTSEASQRLGRLSCFEELDSTNQYLLSERAACGDVCMAERQSAGRGRRGRSWSSPFGQNLYLSLRWHYEQGVAALEGLSLAIGVVIVEVLAQEFGVAGLRLKWPNDLLLNDRKLGGVLVEVGGDLTGDCFAVVGVGLNVSMSRAAALAIDQPWADLLQAGHSVDRNELSAKLISALLPALGNYPQDGFRCYRSRWLRHAAFLDQQINLTTPGKSFSGVMCGVDEGGGLVVKINGQEQVFAGGEVSVRAQ